MTPLAQQFRAATILRDMVVKEKCNINKVGLVSTYGWVYESGKTHIHQYHGCHSDFLKHHAKGRAYTGEHSNVPKEDKVIGFWSQVARYNRCPESELNFLRWMLDPEVSPWRSLLSRSIIIDGQPIHSVDFVRDHGFIITDLTLPANAVVNLVIAGRQYSEFPNSVKEWAKLVEAGVHPSVAHYLRSSFSPQGDVYKPGQSFMHCDTVATPFNGEWVKCFVNGDFTLEGMQPLGEATRYAPCNMAWANVPVAKSYNETPATWKFLSALYPDILVKNTAASRYDTVCLKPITFDQLVSIGKQEQQRLKLDDWNPRGWETVSAPDQDSARLERNVGTVRRKPAKQDHSADRDIYVQL